MCPVVVAVLFWTQLQTSGAYVTGKSCRLSGPGGAVLRVDGCLLRAEKSFNTRLTGVLRKVLG